MTKKALAKAIVRGQGRAILFLREVGPEPYFDFVVSLCKRECNFEYRVARLWRIIELFEDRGRFVVPLSEGLKRCRIERVREQLIELLAHLYRDGHSDAAPFVEDYLISKGGYKYAHYAFDWLRRRGVEHILRHSQLFDDEVFYILHYYITDDLGPKKSEQMLRSLRKEFPAAVRLRERELAERSGEPADRNIPGTQIPLRRENIFKLTDDQFCALAEYGLANQDRITVREVRRCYEFTKRPFDCPPARIFQLVKAEEDGGKKWSLLSLLWTTQHPDVRTWALDILRSRESLRVRSAFCLLELNAEKDDLNLILEVAQELTRDSDDFHGATSSMLDLKVGPSKEMLQLIFEETGCDICRLNCVQQMSRRRMMSEVMWREFAEDFDDYNRKIARRHLRRGRSAKNSTDPPPRRSGVGR